MGSLISLNDEQLMLQYQAGENGAFDILYERWKQRVYLYVAKRVHSKELVFEICQEVFIKLYHKRDLYQDKYPFAAWIYTLTSSTLIDICRKEAKLDRKISPEDSTNDIDSSNDVASMILGDLSHSEKSLLEMRFLQEMKFEEIGLVLNKKPTNVRQMLSRVLRGIRYKYTKVSYEKK